MGLAHIEQLFKRGMQFIKVFQEQLNTEFDKDCVIHKNIYGRIFKCRGGGHVYFQNVHCHTFSNIQMTILNFHFGIKCLSLEIK